ncbi:MAG: 16S rRNA (adenine(1518)-N(6)/adenine(1519)-N(6))-dimethyltransferase RsmA [Chloroflexales bacterium]|nr:16S rRNA (adenine(1518)-N(6)/adenine(1519)-N(6))-dimethyltransferase RsmA [Chloroflexales bacterium]
MNPYITPNRVRAALRSIDLRPTRGMGQNFLVDPDALDAIVAAAALTRDDTALEVGPGLGVLTWELLQRAGRVVSVELDKRLVARLGQEFAGEPRLRIVQGDILRLPPEIIFANHELASTNVPLQPSAFSLQPYKVVANLPYAITSPVLRHFLEAHHKPRVMVVLVQWEVAQRIVAAPGDLSVLAHSVQIYAAADIVARVPATSFVPVPAVDSAVLRLRLYERPAADVDDIDALFRVIKAGFLQPRKKLSNALPGGLAAMGRAIERDAALAALAAAGVSPDHRAEALTLAEWVAVYKQLTNSP